MNSSEACIGHEQYEELSLVLESKGYSRFIVLNDQDRNVNGLFRVERWESPQHPTFLVTICDSNKIQVWGPPSIWLNNGPDESGLGEYFARFFKQPEPKIDEGSLDKLIDSLPPTE